jgi:hypothetical protein
MLRLNRMMLLTSTNASRSTKPTMSTTSPNVDHSAQAEPLDHEQWRGEKSNPPEPARQDTAVQDEQAGAEKREAAEDIANAVERLRQVVQRVANARIVLGAMLSASASGSHLVAVPQRHHRLTHAYIGI